VAQPNFLPNATAMGGGGAGAGGREGGRDEGMWVPLWDAGREGELRLFILKTQAVDLLDSHTPFSRLRHLQDDTSSFVDASSWNLRSLACRLAWYPVRE
jgi:hypothetical protein